MFSILILTGNEEINIRECLESVSWCDDVWVLDSGSKDRTVEIAKKMPPAKNTRFCVSLFKLSKLPIKLLRSAVPAV